MTSILSLLIPCSYCGNDPSCVPKIRYVAGYDYFYDECPRCSRRTPSSTSTFGAHMNWYNEHRPPFSDRAVMKDGLVVGVPEEEEMAMPRGSCGCASNDNWKHRSSNMRCSTCMWYAPKVLNVESDTSSTVGRCRRHAPSMNGFPVVYVDDWCGDHKLDEEKV